MMYIIFQRSAALPTQPRYIVEVRYRRGNYLAEVDLDRTDRATVLTDLLAGQYQGAARVYRLEDATGEFVRALFQHCVDEGEDVPLWPSSRTPTSRLARDARPYSIIASGRMLVLMEAWIFMACRPPTFARRKSDLLQQAG